MRSVLTTAARFVLATAVALAAPVRGARAQQPQPQPQPQPRTDPDGCVSATGPDTTPSPRAASSSTGTARDTTHVALRILASASADEVRFVGTPRICVRLTGDARLDSVHVLARRNIASPVVSGTTYRNVYVAVEILGHLNADCIASRITGAPADSARAAHCASLDAGARAGAGRP